MLPNMLMVSMEKDKGMKLIGCLAVTGVLPRTHGAKKKTY